MKDVLTAFRDESVAVAKNGGGDDTKQSHDVITRVIVRMDRAAVRRRVFEGEGNAIVSLIVLTLGPMFNEGMLGWFMEQLPRSAAHKTDSCGRLGGEERIL
jgi:hypothetical protein